VSVFRNFELNRMITP